MILRIEGQTVKFNDEEGKIITITTAQLFEMMRLLKMSFTEDGISVFGTLMFTV